MKICRIRPQKFLAMRIMLLHKIFLKNITRQNMQQKYAEFGHKKGTKNIKNLHRILKPSKVTVYAEKYEICRLLENMQSMS